MSVQRFIDIDSTGALVEIVPATSSAGTATAGQVVALNTSGIIDSTMLPGTNTTTMTASEALAGPCLINVWSNAGSPAIRNADNSTAGKEANGFVLASIASGATGTVTLREGLITGLTGLTAGAVYFLGTVGAPTLSVTTTAGTILQRLGRASSTTSLNFVEHLPITRA